MNGADQRFITRKSILLVDDNDDDLVLMRRAFEKTEFNILLHAVHDGVEAIAYLKGEDPYTDRNKFPLPAVMLLDLNMPKKDGFAVLSWLRTQPVLKRLTVIILTASMRMEIWNVRSIWERIHFWSNPPISTP